MSLYHVYFSKDIFIVFMIKVVYMDHNAEILRVICLLRDIGVAWRGGDELHNSLSASLESIVDNINRSNGVLNSKDHGVRCGNWAYQKALQNCYCEALGLNLVLNKSSQEELQTKQDK